MKRELISTNQAPEAVGPYSQALLMDNLVFVSMQIGIDPATQQLVEGGVQPQTLQALENISSILKKAGTDCSRVFKSTVFLRDMNHFKMVNGLYAQLFSPPYPARSVIEVSSLPLDAEIAIDVIAGI